MTCSVASVSRRTGASAARATTQPERGREPDAAERDQDAGSVRMRRERAVDLVERPRDLDRVRRSRAGTVSTRTCDALDLARREKKRSLRRPDATCERALVDGQRDASAPSGRIVVAVAVDDLRRSRRALAERGAGSRRRTAPGSGLDGRMARGDLGRALAQRVVDLPRAARSRTTT